ncbi:hypothetical protein KD050_18885 [Psychrobacillus sp. INOP01]|uniref:hypothetical protein n=1 Tax=Psychrobacillus sp. INOP01 TaxID=2829187 RepID=UPI001BA79B81|nr:hypothetical protein [Psychrobacillus sp. INOP01]QUG41316.1 hypothetical protein KD050_18885 [Psychrobacillus sp. INOP01]
MFKVGIKRTESEVVVTVKTDVPGEKAFKFDSLSPTITSDRLRLILPLMIETQRDKRAARAHRKLELAEEKAEREERAEKMKEANANE